MISDEPVRQLFFAFVFRARDREFVGIDEVFDAGLQTLSMKDVLALWHCRHLNVGYVIEAHVALII